MRLTNNQIALLAILFMIPPLVFNTLVYQRANVVVTGKSTVEAHISLCINRPPLLVMDCPTQAEANSEYYCDVNVSDLDNSIITGIQSSTFSDNTELFDINPSTGVIQFTPTISQTGNYTITITVNDNSSCANSMDSDTFNLIVFYCGDGSCNGDETCNTCPEDCGPCPTVPSAAAGGAGGGGVVRERNITKKVLLELVAPPPKTLFAGDKIDILIKLGNRGEVALYGISLETETDIPNATLALSENLFNKLDINEENQSILTIRSLILPTARIGINRYLINVKANVNNPQYNTSIKFFVDLKERNYETRIETLNQIKFAQDLFKQNPECLEFNEILKQAQDAYDNSEYDKALSLISSAIKACRDLIASEKEMKEAEKPAPKKGIDMAIFIIGAIALLALLFAILYYYRKRRGKKGSVPTIAKSDLESRFDDMLNKTKRFIKHNNLIKAREGYLSLYTIYKTIRSSSLSHSKKVEYHQKLSKVYSEVSKLIKK